jgi:hypothetical protein
MVRRALALSSLVGLAGCASVGRATGSGGDGGATHDGATVDRPRSLDLAGMPDLAAAPDLSTVDGEPSSADGAVDGVSPPAPADQAASVDAAAPPDQAAPPASDLAVADLSTPADLTRPPDSARADLAKPDLAVPADLAVPPDLTPPPDLAPVCMPVTNPCDVFCDNCPQGQKCAINAMNQPQCLADGNVATGQPCGQQGVDDCVAGDVCIRITLGGATECAQSCRVDADCRNGGRCDITLNGVNLQLCTDPITGCQPVPPQAGCNGGACYVLDGTGDTGCHAPAGVGGACAACASQYDCAAGFVCFGGSNLCLGAVGCLRLCHPAAPACPNPQNCYQVRGWPATLGVCDL